MKKLLAILFLIAGLATMAVAQAPQGFKYQAVARDASNQPYQNTNLGVRISLIRDGASGVIDYSESHQVTTTDLGVLDLSIGEGTALFGNFSSLDWGIHAYYLKVDIDPAGGSAYLNMGVSQLMSVPYALYAREAGSGSGGDGDDDSTNEIQSLVYNPATQQLSISDGNTISLNIPTGSSDDQVLTLTGTMLTIEDGNSIDLSVLQDGTEDADADPTNELQDLTFNPATNALSISGGSTIIIPSGGTDADADPTNELQTITKSGNTVTLSDGGGSFTDAVDDADADPTNELQDISLSGTNLSISDGSTLDLSVIQDGVNDADADPTNEVQSLSFNPGTNELSISGSNTVTIPTGGTDADADPTNELQDISLSGTNLSISDGSTLDLSVIQDGVDDADNDPNNEIETWATLAGIPADIADGDDVDDADADPTNEIQSISLMGNTLSLSNGGGNVVFPPLGLTLPFSGSIDLPGEVAFAVTNSTVSNGVAIAAKKGAGSSIGVVTDAAIFGTSEQGHGIVGFTSSAGAYAGIWGRTNNVFGYGVAGRADGGGIGGYFTAPTGYALITDEGNVGIGVTDPDELLEVNGTMRINSNVGAFQLGYPDNGNLWSLSTLNGGADLLFRSKENATTDYFTRVIFKQSGRVGLGTTLPQAQMEIVDNSTTTKPQLLLTENEADFARLSFENTTVNARWSIAGLTTATPADSKLNFWFQNTNGGADRMTILGNGNVGIGNTDPDEDLVVGTNLSSGWAIKALTVGGNNGGALECGSTDYNVSLSASNVFERARLITSSPSGFGLGDLEIRTSGLSIGQSPGADTEYMVKVVHESFGLNLGRNETDFDWELYTALGNGELRLYYDGTFRGAFSPTDGLYTASDRRLKTNIHRLQSVLPSVLQLEPSKYRYIDGNPEQKSSLGFIAQDVEKFFPELVSVTSAEDERTPGLYALNYAGFGVLAIEAIQEQQAIIESQQAEIDDLKARMERLEALLKK